MIAVSGESYNIIDVAARVASQRTREDVARENERPLPPLPKSLSSPFLLPWNALTTYVPPRRTKSELGLDGSLKVPKQRSLAPLDLAIVSKAVSGEDALPRATADTTSLPSFHVQEPTVTASAATTQRASTDRRTTDAGAPREEPHLYTMDISHQLRSMSQLSDPVDDDASLTSGHPWNFHHRERSGTGMESSARSRHSRVKSNTGLDSMALPSAWGRVRSPTAASSIYSRPTSAGANAADTDAGHGERSPQTLPADYGALFADWPLRPSASTEGSTSKRPRLEKPLPPPPSDSRRVSGPDSFVTAKDKDDTEITWLSPPRDTSAAPRTSSSSIISASSKKSRFLERFSPPKRTVRKRRSIFKFLRPGSRKQQARSISTPILSTKPPSRGFDGPSDDPALLTVQYELVEQSQHPTRSASMNQLGAASQSTGMGQGLTPHPLQRAPTLADYERKLSVVGDDRRRPSSMNLTRLNEIQEEDRRESMGIRRKLSRAKELKDDASPLMAQALTKHQQEKEAFRASSKRRDSDRVSRPTPIFSASVFGPTSSSLAPTPEDTDEALDPLAETGLADSSGLENSTSFLSPLAAAGPSRRTSTATGPTTASTGASSPQLKAARSIAEPSRQPRIGTSLASWSRYPSHTRFERCGSAGRGDNVITRDFALDFDPVGVHASDDSDADSTGPHPGDKVKPKQAKKLQKSRSLTFGSIMRYYSNLFTTSGFSGQNRRTSVTVGGRLEHPELEMLPPQVPTERQHGHETLKHLKDIVKEEAEMIKEFVEEEEGKIGDYVRKEEGKLESFVREEEGKLEKFVEEEEDMLEGFVKKEEGKLMKFVHEEEDKWMHHQDHHHAVEDTPFRHGSIFNSDVHPHQQRRDTMIGPNNDDADEQAAPNPPTALQLDGTATALPSSGPSKAQLWSDLYQQCIVERPPSRDPLRAESMPPPFAAPKPRIRRFPSVTVVDDRKGHYRSISLISVQTGRS